MGNLINIFTVFSQSALKIVSLVVPLELIQREKTLKSFSKEIPVWMDEEYL